MTRVTSSYDLHVPLAETLSFDADALAESMADLGLETSFPPGVALTKPGLHFVPAEVAGNGLEGVQTGVSLSFMAQDEVVASAELMGAVVESAHGHLHVFANEGPGPADPNAVVLAFFVGGTVALLTGSPLVDPQTGERYTSRRELLSLLARVRRDLVPSASRGVFPFALFAAIEAEDVSALETELGPDTLEARDDYGNTPLILALNKRHVPMVKLLLARGADLLAENAYGKSVLHGALELGDPEFLARVLEVSGKGVETMLQFAANGYEPGVRALVEAGVSIDAASPGGWTELILAVYGNEVPLTRWLLETGVEVDRENQDGATALMVAADHGRMELVELLLAQGADPNHRGVEGQCAADWAEKHGFPEVAKLLRAKMG